MRLVRSIPYVLLLALLVISTAADVRAQPASTSISDWNSPSRALIGRDLTVTVTVRYDRGYYRTDILYVTIFNDDATTYETAVLTGHASSSPDACSPTSEGAQCIISPASNSGTESVTFELSLGQMRTWNLVIVTGIQSTYSPYEVVSGSSSYQKFRVSVTDKVQLTVRAQDSVSLIVDGVPQNPGKVFLEVYPGTHSLSAPATVDVNPGERLRFDHWSDGSTDARRTVTLNDDTQFDATYVKQFLLTVTSPYGNATGTGWYDEGDTATFSVVTPQPMSGLYGLLGGKYVFDHWSEGSTATAPTATLTMDKPGTVKAGWRTDYAMPYVVIGAIAAAVAIVVVLLAMRKRRRPETVAATASPQPIPQASIAPPPAVAADKFCMNCGATLPAHATFCNKCGTKQ